jgi:hypothetical protein
MVAIPRSRELLERCGKVHEKTLFGTAGIPKRQVPALVRLTDKGLVAHLASSYRPAVGQNGAKIFPEILKNSGNITVREGFTER